MKSFFLIIINLVFYSAISQTYRSAFDKLESAIGIHGESHSINTGNHALQIIEPSYLDSYLNMFLATNDKRYLDKFIIHAKRVQNHRDDDAFKYTNEIANGSNCNPNGFPDPFTKTWSTDEEWANCSDCQGWYSRVLYTGGLTYPMARFIYIMNTNSAAIALLNSSLPSEVYQSADLTSSCYSVLNNYGDFVSWLQCRVNESIQYHNANWCGLYNMLPNLSDPCGDTELNLGGGCKITNEVEVLNMQCAMGRALIMMYKVESLSGGNSNYAAEYSAKSQAIANFVLSKMQLNNNTFTWKHNYGVLIEDVNHANIIMSFADLDYRYNISGAFDLNNMQLLGRTFSEKLYEAPLKAHTNTLGTNFGNQDLGPNNYPNNFHLLGYYGPIIPYNDYAYQIISDMYSGGATGSYNFYEYDALSALNAFSNLALHQKILNPIAVMRNNQSNKQWSGAAGGDFDGDGVEEIVTYNKSDGELQVYDLNSNNTITASQISHNEGNQIADIAAGELLGAHLGDEVVAVTTTGQIIMYSAIGLFSSTPNTFFPSPFYQLPASTSQYVGIEIGDVLPNIPGNEIIVATAYGLPYILTYNQTTSTINLLGQQINHINGNIPINNFTIGDFDPSNPGDEVCIAFAHGIFMHRISSNLAGYFVNVYIDTPVPNLNNPWEAVTSGDYDGDGIDEIIVTKHDDGKATMLKYKNNALVEVTNEYFKPDQLISTAASFKKNGKDVVALLRDYDGQIAMFDMEGLCPSLYLNNQTIDNSTSIDNIYTSAQNNYPLDYHAHNILAISNFNITENGTTAIFTAGKEIAITNEFGSEAGTEMSAYIDDNLACTTTVFRKAKTNETNNTEIDEKKQTNLNSLNVFPNPTNGKTQLKYNTSESIEINITILNINGQLIYDKTINAESGNNTIELDLSYLDNGIYFLSIDNKSNNNKQTGKIVVIK